MMENWLIWLIVTALLVVVELFTFIVATFCMAVGSMFAMVASLFDASFEMQILALVVGTVLAFVAFAPAVKRWQKRRAESAGNNAMSNMDALKGRVVEVIEDIPEHGTGRVKVDGDRWQARIDGAGAVAGERVRIVGYDSIILEVEKL